MTDWKKISLIVGTIVVGGGAIITAGNWALGKYLSGQQTKKNAEEAPLVSKRLDAHELGDTIKYINVMNEMKNMRGDMTNMSIKLDKVAEALEENNQLRKWEKFNKRKVQ